mmetsp:Transcript_104075/g.206783  ORF Transcript_104075/g.206783 Transcript_104075/m.206783 type:complete len:290 (-) Transcript_104075:1189-2058(-)
MQKQRKQSSKNSSGNNSRQPAATAATAEAAEACLISSLGGSPAALLPPLLLEIDANASTAESHCFENLLKVLDASGTTMQLSSATVWRIVAPTVDNARGTVDELCVSQIHTSVNPGFELGFVVPAILLVLLDRIQPIEEACNPLKLRRTSGADFLRVFAEVDIWVTCITPLSCSPSTHVVVKLTKVADACGLDHTTAPPTTTLYIHSALRLLKQGCRRAWASTASTASTVEGPSPSLDARIVLAAAPTLDILEVSVKRNIVTERRFVVPATRRSTPRGSVVPAWCFWHL